MVPATAVTPVAGEETAVVGSLERHAEVVALGVERVAGVGEMVPFVLADMGDEDVEPAKPGVPVAGEIEVAVGPKGGKFLVAGRVDGGAQVLYAAESGYREAHAPDVETALAARHVGREVEPFAVGREGGMGKTRQRIAGELHLRDLAPSGIRAVGLHYLCVAGV